MKIFKIKKREGAQYSIVDISTGTLALLRTLVDHGATPTDSSKHFTLETTALTLHPDPATALATFSNRHLRLAALVSFDNQTEPTLAAAVERSALPLVI